MSLPAELPDIGPTAQRLRQNPRFDPVAAGIGPEEYFVWTRFDGATTLHDLILMTGLASPRALDIVRKLRALGAILLPDERPEAVALRVRASMQAPDAPPTASAAPAASLARPPSAPVRVRQETDSTPTVARGPLVPIPPPPPRPAAPARPVAAPATAPVPAPAAAPPAAELDFEEQATLSEPCDLSVDERSRILVMHRRIRTGDAAVILGVSDASDPRALKRAYFALSKEFHPDRFYGKRLGSFALRLTEIFEAMSRAHEALAGGRVKRPSPSPAAPAAAPSPTDHAADLFDRACHAEVSGDRAGALRLFAAALRLDAPSKYLRRAARCAMQADALDVSLEYAKKAANLEPNDPSTARLLAQAFRAAGKLADAEETLVLALMIKTENDSLSHELQTDLAEIRRLASR